MFEEVNPRVARLGEKIVVCAILLLYGSCSSINHSNPGQYRSLVELTATCVNTIFGRHAIEWQRNQSLVAEAVYSVLPEILR